MILLDTNVIWEPLQQAPDDRAVAWIDAQIIETLYLSAISVAELRFIGQLAASRHNVRHVIGHIAPGTMSSFQGHRLNVNRHGNMCGASIGERGTTGEFDHVFYMRGPHHSSAVDACIGK